MIEKLSLTLNAQFFRLAHGALEDSQVRKVLDAAEANSDGHAPLANEFRRKRATPSGIDYRFSLRVFLSTRPVFFVSDPTLYDSIHAFVLILEFDQHIAVFKKSCGNISEAIDAAVEPLGYDEIIATIDDNNVAFQKLSARQITVAETAIRARSYEAPDLKGSLSTHAAGRSVPYFLRLREKGKVRSITLSTGRLFDTADRQSIDATAEWAANRLKAASGASEFIANFARSVELQTVLRKTAPRAILIDAGGFLERMQVDGLQISYSGRNGRSLGVSTRVFNAILSGLEQVYEIADDGRIDVELGSAYLRKNKRTLTFESTVLRRFKLRENGKDVTLQRFLVSNNLYTITFDKPTYVYTAGNCFEDRSGTSEIGSIKQLLHPQDSLASLASEKGTFHPGTMQFSSTSVFSVVEAIHAAEEFLICDDLGDEWADHIALDVTNACVSFVHSKHGDVSTSASNLHDVVGQAVKNLGNMVFSADRFLEKYASKWSNRYPKTKISRLRRGNARGLKSSLDKLLADPRLHRKCIICCSFLSKRALIRELNKLERGDPVAGHITQMVWILSSFAHAVRDANSVPIVYCAP